MAAEIDGLLTAENPATGRQCAALLRGFYDIESGDRQAELSPTAARLLLGLVSTCALRSGDQEGKAFLQVQHGPATPLEGKAELHHGEGDVG